MADIWSTARSLIPSVLSGESPAEQRIAQGFKDKGLLSGLGGAISNLPSLAGDVLGTSLGFGAAGQALGAASGVTGKDVTTGQKLDPWMRGLGLAGLIGLGAAAPRAVRLYRGARAAGLEDLGAVGRIAPSEFRPVGSAWSTGTPEGPTSHLGLTSEPDFRWPGLKHLESNQLLAAQNWNEATSALAHNTKPQTTAVMRGLLRNYGTRLTSEVEDHLKDDPFDAATLRAAQFNASVNDGLLSDPSVRRYADLWNKARNGAITVQDLQDLEDFMVRYARTTQWVQDPEMALVPGVRWVGVVDTPDGLRTDIRAIQFDYNDLRPASSSAADRKAAMMLRKERLRAVLRDNPDALTPHGVNNVLRVFGSASDEDIQKGLSFYAGHHGDLVTAAGEHNLTPSQMAAVVAAVSDGMPWEENIAAAKGILRGDTGMQQVSPENVSRVNKLLASRSPEAYWFGTGAPGEPVAGRVAQDLAGRYGTSMKQPSFNANLTYPGGEAFGYRPVTVDRHAIGVFLGFVPGIDNPTALADLPGVYEAIGNAYRIAAHRISELSGTAVTPEQVQAVTWFTWKRYADGRLNKWWASPKFGGIPKDIGDSTVYDVVRGANTPDLPSVLGGVPRTELLVPADQIAKSIDKHTPPKGFGIASDADGTVHIYAPDSDENVAFLRGLHPTGLAGSDSMGGSVHWLPNRAAMVDDWKAHAERLDGSGGRVYVGVDPAQLPGLRAGRWLVVNAPSPKASGHSGLVGELRRKGIEPASVEVMQPHNGFSKAWRTPQGDLTWNIDEAANPAVHEWHQEAMVSLVMGFKNPDDLQAAWRIIHDPAEDGKALWEKLYPDEDVLDSSAYVYTPGEAPPDATRVIENYYQDRAGNTMVQGAHVGDPRAANTVYAHINPGFAQYIEDGGRAVGASVERTLRRIGEDAVYDGQLRIATKPNQTLVASTTPRSPFDLRVDGEHPTHFALTMPQNDLPVIAFGTDADQTLARYGTPVVRGEDLGDRIVLRLPVGDGGTVNYVLADEALGVLTHTGVRRAIFVGSVKGRLIAANGEAVQVGHDVARLHSPAARVAHETRTAETIVKGFSALAADETVPQPTRLAAAEAAARGTQRLQAVRKS